MLHVVNEIFHLVGEQLDVVRRRRVRNSVQGSFHGQVVEDVANYDCIGWFWPEVVFNRSCVVVNGQ